MELKFRVSGLRFRRGDGALGPQDQGRLVRQRLSNHGVKGLRAGDLPSKLAEIIAQRQRQNLAISVESVEAGSEAAAARSLQAERPEMLDSPRLSFRVARVVIVGSLSNGRKVAEEINAQNPGSRIRIPTKEELLKAFDEVGNELESRYLWIWTNTEHEDNPGQFVLRRQDHDDCFFNYPDRGWYSAGVRFVEDK